jgi:hypothetical protein
MGLWKDLIGTTKALFQIEIGGVKLGNSSGNLTVKNGSDADSDVTMAQLHVSGEVIEINSDAANSGADRKYTIQRPITGMGAAVVLTLPPDDGSPNQVLATDGNGVLTFVDAGVTSSDMHVDTTTLNWDSAAVVACMTVQIGTVVEKVRVIIDTPFNGSVAATMSVGKSGSVSKYMATTQVDLTGTAKNVYETQPGEPAVTSAPEDIQIAFAAASGGTPNAGSARIEIYYTIPA